jgi:hypothetical protein
MCTVLLPPGGYPIAVIYISYHIISYQISFLFHSLLTNIYEMHVDILALILMMTFIREVPPSILDSIFDCSYSLWCDGITFGSFKTKSGVISGLLLVA